MPRGDRTGPLGQGPMTGRGLGYCAGYDSPGYTRGYGMGYGRGYGFGRRWGGFGWGRTYWGTPPPPPVPNTTQAVQSDEVSLLKSQAQALQDQLKQVLDRLEGLLKKDSE